MNIATETTRTAGERAKPNAASNQQIDQRRIAATPRGVGIGFPFYAERARNAELWDVEGRRFIDFGSGIAVLNTGHRHPRVMKAVAEQLERFTHTAYQVVPYESVVSLAERLNQLTPGTHAKKTAFFTTGAEAVENAIKIARAATRRPGVIALGGGFHGRTLMGLALTGKVAPYKAGFGPFPGSVYHVPAPVPLHGVSVDDSLRAIQQLFKADIDPEQVAAIIVEPVQGEGGFYVMPAEFMRSLREICDRHGIVLIADEIQTGFGRTGKWFAIEHAGIEPDIMCLAKGLGGGFPMGAFAYTKAIREVLTPGAHGSTFGGSPLACAAGLAAIEAYKDEDLIKRSSVLGADMRNQLRGALEGVAMVRDIRGLGLMIAVELRTKVAPVLKSLMLNHGVIALPAGPTVLRLLPPLVISEKEINFGVQAIAKAIKELQP